MTPGIRAALFDLDGVVVFTDRYHYLAWKELADRRGWDFDEEINNLCRGIPRMASLEVILGHNRIELSPPEKESLADWKNRRYVELLGDIGPADIYPGVVPFLESLREKDLRTGLCSSSRNARLVLKNLGLDPLFDTVVAGDEISRAKPDPEIFLLGASRLGVEPSACVVFEDAPSGVEAALAAGMKCVGVGPADLLARAPVTLLDYREIDFGSLTGIG